MASFDWKKSIEDSINNGVIITITTTGIFYTLKAANVEPPKVSLDAMDVMKLVGGNSRWCPCQRLCSLQKMYQRLIQQTFYSPIKGNKITQCQGSFQLLCLTFQLLKYHQDW